MLQQTQVATVIPYFLRFMARFPDIRVLAEADIDEVLAHWSGLGYYARGRNLHAAAQVVVERHDGAFPTDYDAICALPGIGPSTAAAICAQAYGQAHAVLDGNVKRVLARHADIEGWPGQPRISERLQREADLRLPTDRLADYTQAIMDLGATLCRSRRPDCEACPVNADCLARAADRVEALPTPKPKRARPVRESYLLLMRDREDRYWLAPRPPVGIWGGLWAPPVVDRLEPPPSHPALDIHSGQRLPPLRHALTHFEWRLQPLLWTLDPTPTAADSSGDWVTIADALALGLPAPVRALFIRLKESPK
jgi:A/G-specific adenine glycosylase